MVCLVCLLPLFLIPVVNMIPLLFDYCMAKFYQLLGWQYRKPERAPPTCPYKPSRVNKSNTGVNTCLPQPECSSKNLDPKSIEADEEISD